MFDEDRDRSTPASQREAQREGKDMGGIEFAFAPSATPGVFMRASLPSDRMSWKQKMHVCDTLAIPTRIISHATLRSSSMPLYCLKVARVSGDVPLYQPTCAVQR